MLNSKKTSSASLLLCILVIVCALQSCENEGGEISRPDNVEKGKAALELADKLPKVRFIDSSGENGRISGYSDPGTFNFSDEPSGVSFSSSADITFEEGPDGGFIVVDITSLAGGGGSVTAGSNNYAVDVAFCFSSDDPLELFDEQVVGSGFSGVIGFVGTGDIESLEDLESFQGNLDAIVYYAVFDDNPQGAYNVIQETDEAANLNRKGVAMISDVKRGKLYISTQGTISVSDNSMAFQGSYIEFDEETEQMTEVTGSGEIGCF